MTCLSLVPISLMDRTAPKPPDEFRFSIASIWAVSPLACFGCITIGMTNSTFRLMGPIYASDIGFDTTGVATFMSAGIIGGAVLQLPLGWLSDRLDRRWVLIIATLGAAACRLRIVLCSRDITFDGPDRHLHVRRLCPAAVLACRQRMPMTGQNAGQYVIVAAGLSFFFSLGAMIGPFVAAQVLSIFGPDFFFTYTSIVHLSLVAVTLWRMTVRRTPDMKAKKRYATLLRTSPVMYQPGPQGRQQRPTQEQLIGVFNHRLKRCA